MKDRMNDRMKDRTEERMKMEGRPEITLMLGSPRQPATRMKVRGMMEVGKGRHKSKSTNSPAGGSMARYQAASR